MSQSETRRHLEALATIAAATTEPGALASRDALQFLHQHLQLRGVHVCRAGDAGGPRMVEIGADSTECGLPKPGWHQLGCKTETDAGWVAGFVVTNPPEDAILHLLSDREPDRDDLAAGVVAATLIASMLTARTSGLDQPDPITGLPGRPVLERCLLDRFAAQDPTGSVSLILADVNGLKSVNDRFGHHAGDRLLRRVAAVVSEVAGSLDAGALAARIGGDEFAIAVADVSGHAIENALERIDASARELGDGTGIARGAARLPGDAPGSRTPTIAMHGLIRLADAQLYAHKAATVPLGRHARRDSRGAARRGWAQTSRSRAGVVPRVLLGGSVEERLSHTAQLVAEEANAAAWWISRQHGDTVIDTRCGPNRRQPMRWDEPEQPVVLESKAYRLDDFPDTRRALTGGHFHASLTEGDPTERAILAYVGYRSVMGAGGTDQQGRGWLVEIYGDYLTEDLSSWGETLSAAIQDALVDPGGRAQSPATTVAR